MLVSLVLTIGLAFGCLFIHYEVLRLVSGLMPEMHMPPRRRLLVVISAASLAHVLEIGLYALGYAGMAMQGGLGQITGDLSGNWLDYFYFSAATYSTLGMGDVFVLGPMRLVAGVEALIGLILITWSASFTYLAMEKFWGLHPKRKESVRDDMPNSPQRHKKAGS